MPRLELFGLRTAVSGDDLHIFSVIALIMRFVQLGLDVALLPFLVALRRRSELCQRKRFLAEKGDSIMFAFWALSVILSLLSIPLDLLMYVGYSPVSRWHADAGTLIMNSHWRPLDTAHQCKELLYNPNNDLC